MTRQHRRRWGDDRGAIGIAATVLVVIVIAGAGLIYDGGRALAARRQIINVAEAAARAGAATATADGLSDTTARSATLDYLTAVHVPGSDIVAIAITQTTVTVTLTARRDAVFGQLLGNDRIVVRGTGRASASFAGPAP